jgi:hypothetical protein
MNTQDITFESMTANLCEIADAANVDEVTDAIVSYCAMATAAMTDLLKRIETLEKAA